MYPAVTGQRRLAPEFPAQRGNITIVKKRVLINVEDKDIRVATLEDGQLAQLFVEQIDNKSTVGNVYRGRVEGIVPGLQAAFVNIGMERNAFLHYADILDEFQLPGKTFYGDRGDSKGRGQGKKGAPKNQREMRSGEEIMVQVLKEPLGTKGARVSMNVSLPGRYLVLLPFAEGRNSGGVSKRIQDVSERRRLRDILRSLDVDEGSFIIRTAGLNQPEEEIITDVHKLQTLWKEIQEGNEKCKAPTLVHDDHGILGRLVRDELTTDVEKLIIDDKDYAKELRRILASMMPKLKGKVTVHTDVETNLFEHYDVENQYQKALRNRVWLKSGGYIIVDETEALISIDVNSGKFVGKNDQEEMILKTNMEAADTVTRQLRLREVGGIIVVDFIDMRSRENQRALMRKFSEYLTRDRAKTTVCPLSDLGLLEMTRKRVRQSLSKVVFRKCPYCNGLGQVLTEQQIWKNVKYDIMAWVKEHPKTKDIQVTLHPIMRTFLENEVLDSAHTLANHCQVALNFVESKDFHIERFELTARD